MMKIALTQEEESELKQVQRNAVGTDYMKVTGILMLHRGFFPRTVSESLGIDVSTVLPLRRTVFRGWYFQSYSQQV
jgi:hypothetical protein